MASLRPVCWRALPRRALLVLAATACGGATCGNEGGSRPPVTTATTVEGRAVQKVSRQLESTGVAVDTSRLRIETKARDAIASDLDAQVDLGLRGEQLRALWQLRGVLEATPAIRSLDDLRRRAVEARLPELRVFYSATRKALVFIDPEQQDQTSLEAATGGQLVFAFYDQGPGGLAETLYDQQGTLDGARVRSCLLEGHAALAMLLARHGGIDTLDEEALEALDPEATSLFATLSDAPCGAGARFLHDRYREGGWPAVLRAVRNPPPSSEQLLHPAKVDQDFPVNVALPGWPEDEYEDPDPIGKATLIFEDVLGELTIERLLRERGVEPAAARRATVGWDGDRLRLYEHESGQTVMIWRSAWDREVDAEQFAAAIAPKGIDARAFRVRRHGRVVDAVSTAGPELADRLHEALSARPGEPSASPADASSTAAIEARLPQ